MILRTSLVYLCIGLIAIVGCQPSSPPEYQMEEHMESTKQGVTTQGAGNLVVALLQTLLRSVLVPLLSNVGVGLTNAVTASLMGRELALLANGLPYPLGGGSRPQKG